MSSIDLICPGERLQGIDLSKWQRHVDWPRVRDAGVSFCWVKSSQRHYADPMYQQHIDGADSVGIVRGAYHFADLHPYMDPIEQAEAWHHHAGDWQPGQLPPMYDLEWASARVERIAGGKDKYLRADKVAQYSVALLARADELFGVRPVIYTGPSFWRSVMASTNALAGYSLVVADYRKASRSRGVPVLPTMPNGEAVWTDWLAWQWTGKGAMDGVTRSNGDPANVDRIWLNGGEAELQRLIHPDVRGNASAERGQGPRTTLHA